MIGQNMQLNVIKSFVFCKVSVANVNSILEDEDCESDQKNGKEGFDGGCHRAN